MTFEIFYKWKKTKPRKKNQKSEYHQIVTRNTPLHLPNQNLLWNKKIWRLTPTFNSYIFWNKSLRPVKNLTFLLKDQKKMCWREKHNKPWLTPVERKWTLARSEHQWKYNKFLSRICGENRQFWSSIEKS